MAAALAARFGDDNADYYRREAGMLMASGFTGDEIELAIAQALADGAKRFDDGRSLFRYIARSLPNLSARVRSTRPADPAPAASPAPAPRAHAGRPSVAERISADNAARAAKTRAIFARRKSDAGG